MEIKVPSVEAIKFNPHLLADGTPIRWKQTDTHDHYFLALVKEYGPNMVQVYNGHVFHTFNVMDVHRGTIEIVPLIDIEEGSLLIIETIVFDVFKIPAGSIFVDADGMSFMVSEVDPYYLEIIDHKGNHQDVKAETFFGLDQDETEACRIILPPLFVEEMKVQAQSYKDKV